MIHLHGAFVRQFCAQQSCYRPYQFLTTWCNLQIRTLSKCSQTAKIRQNIFLCNSKSCAVSVYCCPLRDPRFSRQSKRNIFDLLNFDSVQSVQQVQTFLSKVMSLSSGQKSTPPRPSTCCLCLQSRSALLHRKWRKEVEQSTCHSTPKMNTADSSETVARTYRTRRGHVFIFCLYCQSHYQTHEWTVPCKWLTHSGSWAISTVFPDSDMYWQPRATRNWQPTWL